MPISEETVAHMAVLARLDIDAPTRERFARQFGDIIKYMEILRNVDTEGVAPLYSPVLHAPQPRADEAVNRRQREEILGNAPDQNGAYFIVPRIV